jgi:SAM-dependent methyltransferase
MYKKALTTLLRDGAISLDDSIVVFCGGTVDADALRELGFKNVTITNLDERYEACAPYQWSLQDAEGTSFKDASYDWAMVHAGLHHCYSPHRALLEMLRVTRKGVLVIEARDSALMRAAVKLGLTPDFEIHAVIGEKRLLGGVAVTARSQTSSTAGPNEKCSSWSRLATRSAPPTSATSTG